MSKNDNPRPLLVTLIAVIYLLMALVFLAAAALSLGGIELEIDMSEGLLSLFGGSSLILGLFLLVISIGFFRGWSIFWYLGVIVTVISLLLSAATDASTAFETLPLDDHLPILRNIIYAGIWQSREKAGRNEGEEE